MPQETIENIDELELLLSDLADLEGLDEAVESKEEAVPAKEEATPSKEEAVQVDDEDVEALLSDLEEAGSDEVIADLPFDNSAETPAVVTVREPVEVQVEPVVEELDEVEALLAEAAAEPEPTPAIAPKPAHESDAFVPESDLRTFINPEKLKTDLEFSVTSISGAMTRQASLFAHYSMLAHQAQFQADRADQQVDLVEAQLDQKYRDSFSTSGVKATETMIKSAIIKDERYQKAMLRKHESKAIAEMVRSAADSFRHRRDMLIQVGADLRQEAQGSVRTKEAQHPGQAALSRLGQTN